MRTTDTTDPTTDTAGGRLRHLASSVAVGTLILGAAGLGMTAVASADDAQPSPTGVTEPPSTWQAIYVGCMRTAAATPDALEHYVDTCAARATAFFDSPAYVRCARGMSADAAERWARTCAEQALTSSE